jgi:hypothetical protein
MVCNVQLVPVLEEEDEPVVCVSIGLDGPGINATQGGSKGKKEKKRKNRGREDTVVGCQVFFFYLGFDSI